MHHHEWDEKVWLYVKSTHFPNLQRRRAKMEAQSEYVRIAYMIFARPGTDSHARSVLSNKISASELRRKFIKSALLVGLMQHLYV